MLLNKRVSIDDQSLSDADWAVLREQHQARMANAPLWLKGKNLATHTTNIAYSEPLTAQDQKLLKEFESAIPTGAIVDPHAHEIGNVSIKAPVQKDIHRSDILALDHSRALSELEAWSKEKLNTRLETILLLGSESENEIIKNTIIPLFIEKVANIKGLGAEPMSEVNFMLSTKTDEHIFKYVIQELNQLILADQQKSNYRFNSFMADTIRKTEYKPVSSEISESKAVSKTTYESIKAMLLTNRQVFLKNKFLNRFEPYVQKVLTERILPDVMDTYDFSEEALFSFDFEEIKNFAFYSWQEMYDLKNSEERNVMFALQPDQPQ